MFGLLFIAISLSSLLGATIGIIEITDEIRLRRLPVWVSSLRSRKRLYWSHSIRARRRQNRNPLFRRSRYVDRSYLDQQYQRDWFVRTWRLPRFSLNVIAVAASGIYTVVAAPLLFVFYSRSIGGLFTSLRKSFSGSGNILFELVAALFFVAILSITFAGAFYAHVQASKKIITNITRPLVTPPDLAAGNKWKILSFVSGCLLVL